MQKQIKGIRQSQAEYLFVMSLVVEMSLGCISRVKNVFMIIGFLTAESVYFHIVVSYYFSPQESSFLRALSTQDLYIGKMFSRPFLLLPLIFSQCHYQELCLLFRLMVSFLPLFNSLIFTSFFIFIIAFCILGY